MISLGAYEYNANHSHLLGSGAFAYVYKGRVKNKPDELVAIKIMKKDTNMPKNKTLLSKEISVLKDLNHENIVRLFDHGISNNGVYLVMEFCNGGDLSEYLLAKRTLPEDTIRYFLAQIGSAMDAINRKGFMHRDLKPGNILLSHCRNCGQAVTDLPGSKLIFKLADFGFARFLQDGMMAVTMCGSPMYMAPEVLMCRKYDAVADIWSMGVIVYQCLTGTAPFYANNPEALKNIYEKTVNLRPKIPPTTSPLLCDLLLRMLVRKPSERIDFDKFLNHPFLKQRNFDPTNIMSNRTRGQNFQLSARRIKTNLQQPVVDPSKPMVAPPVSGDRGPFYLASTDAPTPDQRRRTTTAPVDTYEQPLDMDDLNNEMSRTTMDEYFEDPLDTSALQLDQVQMYDRKSNTHRPNVPPIVDTFKPPAVAPPVPTRGSSAMWKSPVTHHTVVQPRHTRLAPFGVKPVSDVPLEGFVIVNPDGSESDVGTQLTTMPTVPVSAAPMSNIGRILANPNAYRPLSQPRPPQIPITSPMPDVATMGAMHSTQQQHGVAETYAGLLNRPPSYPISTTPHKPIQIQNPPVSEISGVRLRGTRPVERDVPGKAASLVPTKEQPPPSTTGTGGDSGDLTTAYTTKPRCNIIPIRRPYSFGGPIPVHVNGAVQHVGFWLTGELSDEQFMDDEHNEEIKTITMVLELCELLADLAEQRASILTDFTVTTSSNPTGDQAAAADPSLHRPPKAPAATPEDSNIANSSPTPGLKFLPEARRIVEQIVLYRRVLYYLEYVFAQVKKAFLQGRLKPTMISRGRLTACNALYHRCYIRLRQVAKQSRRDDLIEPVGRLLANISANRLIFQYALIQCQAAEMDEYFGDLDQSVQRYKAGITMLHGLRQHAKSVGDTTLLAECMRLLHERHNTLRLAAAKLQQQQTQPSSSQPVAPQTNVTQPFAE